LNAQNILKRKFERDVTPENAEFGREWLFSFMALLTIINTSGYVTLNDTMVSQ